jgi:hypothetical protein
MKKLWERIFDSKWFGWFLGLCLLLLVSSIPVMASKDRPVQDKLPFSQLVTNKEAYVGHEASSERDGNGKRHQLVLVDGVVLYRENGFCLVSGNPVPALPLEESDYILMKCKDFSSAELKAGDLISVTDPTIEKRDLEIEGGTTITVIYIGQRFTDEVVGTVRLDQQYIADLEKFNTDSSGMNLSSVIPLIYFHIRSFGFP